MINNRAIICAGLLALLAATTSQAQDLGARPLRYGNTSGWYYDNRDDPRDVPTNGFFPGNFTSDPPSAWLGAAGVLAGNSYRGVSINACIEDAPAVARQVAAHVQRTPALLEYATAR